jgi:hypothetical protein
MKDAMEPHLHYKKAKIEGISKGRIYVNGGPTFRSQKLARSLGKSNEIIAFITTIGDRMDEEISRLMKEGLPSEGFILDTLGSVAAESVAKRFHQDVDRLARRGGKAVTLRFSPGYCDWPIKEQSKLFKLFPEGATGVHLTDACLMRPRKSISGVFGVYRIEDAVAERPYNPCFDCENARCTARRI